MLDIQLLRNDPEHVAQRLATRGGAPLDVAGFRALEDERKRIQVRTQDLQAKRNALSKQIGMLKAKGQDTAEVMAEVAGLGEQLKAAEAELDVLLARIDEFAAVVPNLPHESVPVGRSAEDNVEVHRCGTPRSFDFPVKDHVDIGAALGGLDFETAAKISGARFSLMRGAVARLHRALAQFMLDVHTGEHGYTEVYAPYLVNGDSMYGTGQLPKFKADLFEIRRETAAARGQALGPDGQPLPQPEESGMDRTKEMFLIPTAEVPVTNIVRGEIVALEALPLKFVCHTPCFRSEAGSYGKDTRGMIRPPAMPNPYLTGWSCPTAAWPYAPATWASPRPRPTTWRSGCPASRPIARSPRAAISRPSRRDACRRASATRRASRNWCTP